MYVLRGESKIVSSNFTVKENRRKFIESKKELYGKKHGKKKIENVTEIKMQSSIITDNLLGRSPLFIRKK